MSDIESTIAGLHAALDDAAEALQVERFAHAETKARLVSAEALLYSYVIGGTPLEASKDHFTRFVRTCLACKGKPVVPPDMGGDHKCRCRACGGWQAKLP